MRFVVASRRAWDAADALSAARACAGWKSESRPDRARASGPPARRSVAILCCRSLWQRMQWRSRMGWISLRKAEAARRAVKRLERLRAGLKGQRGATVRRGGAVFLCSWQPTQDWFSPGWRVLQLRMVCTARFFSSSAWK